MTDKIIEIHAIAKGKVHGVGFRYTTQRIALEIGIKGTVENLPDGTVEIYAQGSQAQIALFCKRLEEHWKGFMQPLAYSHLDQLNAYPPRFEIK